VRAFARFDGRPQLIDTQSACLASTDRLLRH
jgi:hypothetical protein